MERVIIEIDYVEKSIHTETFTGEVQEVEKQVKIGIPTMKILKEYFKTFNEPYNNTKNVLENLEKLKKNKNILSIFVRNYYSGLRGIFCELSQKYDIFIDNKKIFDDFLNNKFFNVKIK